jgi:hypothetical protein
MKSKAASRHDGSRASYGAPTELLVWLRSNRPQCCEGGGKGEGTGGQGGVEAAKALGQTAGTGTRQWAPPPDAFELTVSQMLLLITLGAQQEPSAVQERHSMMLRPHPPRAF